MLTADDLAAIRERAEAATPGKWEVVRDRHSHYLGGAHVERRIFTEWDHPQLKAPYGVGNGAFGIGATEGEPGLSMVAISEPDAAFIAAARSDIPALLAHIDALTAALEEAPDA
jgi:hypothetical protein